MNLSEHFTLEELTRTEVRKYFAMNSTPPDSVVANLRLLAAKLELVRALLKHPIHITSGYRCPLLNEAVGSAPTSQHLLGLAADFICPEFGTPKQIAGEIAISSIEFDQCILEFGRWVHISFGPRNRLALLTIDQNGTRMGIA